MCRMHDLCCTVVGGTIVIGSVVGVAVFKWLSSKQLLSERPSSEELSLNTPLSKVCLLKVLMTRQNSEPISHGRDVTKIMTIFYSRDVGKICLGLLCLPGTVGLG